MSDGTPPTLESLVRVAIIGPEAAADLAIPTNLPIRELIPRIRQTLASGRDDPPEDLDSDQPPSDDTAQTYSLAPIAGTPYSLDATLETVGVTDGQQLLLRPLSDGPAAPPVIEDIADAAAIHSARQFAAFEHRMLGPAALAAFLGISAMICALSLYGWFTGHRWWSVGALAAVTVTFIIVSVALSRRGKPSGALISVITTAPLAATLATAVPGDAGAPRVFLAAAGVVAWSMIASVLTTRYVAVYTALIAYGVPVALAATARVVGHVSNLTLGCALIAISLAVASTAPTAATRWARFPLPTVPAPGDPVPEPPTLRELEELPRKSAITHAHQSGFIAASVGLLVTAAGLMLWLPDHPPLLAWWVVLAATIVTVLRMRIWHAAAPSLWFAASPFLIAATLATSFTISGHLTAAVWALAGAAGLVATLAGAALITPRPPSVPRRKHLDRFENVLLYTIPPALVWLVGAVSFIRNLGILS